MINTYNESSLHNTLKTLYCQENKGEKEVELFGHIYDIVSKDLVIEIQTKNLGKLLPKILDTIDHGYKVKIVYPLVRTKWIETSDEKGNIISCRKSPDKGSIYSLFDELTVLYPVLLNRNFSLDVMEVDITEKRTKYNELLQTKNKKRRYKKDWLKTGKILKEIISIKTFSTKEDYLSLIPISVLPEFCAKDIAIALKNDKTFPSSASKKAHIMMWVLRRMELLEETCVKNRSHYFKVK